MSDDASNKMTKCLFGCKCLDEDPRYPHCTVVEASGENTLLVSSADGFNCPYHVLFGHANVCTCPTHYSLQRKLDHGGCRRLMSGRKERPASSKPAKGPAALPSNVEKAVQILIDELPLKDKMAIANASAGEVGELTIGLFNGTRIAFGLDSDNQALWRSCSKEAGREIEHPDDAVAVILARLVVELVNTHKLSSV